MKLAICITALVLPLLVFGQELAVEPGSNVYQSEILKELQEAIHASGCIGGLCVCSENNRLWSGVFSNGVSLPSLISGTPTTADDIREAQRAYRQVYRIADTMPIVGRLLSTCKWPLTAFSQMYSDTLKILVAQGQTDEKVQGANAAICELNQIVDDPEPTGDVTQVPRFTLYLRYKSFYFSEKSFVEAQIKSQRELLTDSEFEEWYNENQENLNCRTDSAYQKWEIFGSKRRVEELLSKNDIVTESSLVINAQGLFEAVKSLQETNDDSEVGLLPVSLVPSGWEILFQKRSSGTRDQLLYRLGDLTLRLAKLEGEENAKLITNTSNTGNLLTMNFEMAENEVMRLSRRLQEAKVLCRTGVGNCTEVFVLEEQLMAAANDFIQIYILFKASSDVVNIEEQKALIQVQILEAEARLAALGSVFETIDETLARASSDSFKQRTLLFEWKEDVANLEATPDDSENHLFYRPFLHLLTHPNEVCEYCFKTFYNETKPTSISARLYFLSTDRNWFDASLFDTDHVQKLLRELEENNGIRFAPNAQPEEDLISDLQDSEYLLPYFPVTIVVATNIKIELKGVSNETANAIYQGASLNSQDQIGFGPFTVLNSFEETYEGEYRYRVEGMLDSDTGAVSNSDNRLVVLLEGGQIIGVQYQLLNAAGEDEFSINPPQGNNMTTT